MPNKYEKRITARLDTRDPEEKEIFNDIESRPARRRGEHIRTLLKLGKQFQKVMNGKQMVFPTETEIETEEPDSVDASILDGMFEEKEN